MYQAIELGESIYPQLEEYAIKVLEFAYDKIPLFREYMDLYNEGMGEVFQSAALVALVGIGVLYTVTAGSLSSTRNSKLK